MNSRLFLYCTEGYKSLKNNMYYDFPYKAKEIDFDRPWTDKELYKEFNLTKDEIQEVETWFETWTKDFI